MTGYVFQMFESQMLPKIDATSKGVQHHFMQLLNSVSHEDQSADVLSNEKRKKKSGRFFGLGKLCWVNLGLNSKGIAMSSCIGQAMHYTVAFPQSREFEIYKCHTLFFERITVEETDVFRHQ